MEEIKMSTNSHWVEDLFPPLFPIDIGEPIAAKEELPSAKPNVYELASKHISRFDPETIKNVYERVWLMNAVQERKEQESEAKVSTQSDKKLHKDDPICGLFLDSINLKDYTLQPITDTDDSQLWSSEEIAVLREVFTAAKKENVGLKFALTESNQRLKGLEKVCSKHEKEINEKAEIMSEAKKANARLQLLIRRLKAEVEEMDKENTEVRDDLEDLREQKSDVDKELSNLKNDLYLERRRSDNLQDDLKESRQVAAQALQLQEQMIVARFSHQVAGLQKQIEALKGDLEKENQAHGRCRKGLEHLQKHFSVLPLQSAEKRRTMVTEDELSTWSY